MMQRHIFLSIFLVLSVSLTNAMHKWTLSEIKHQRAITCATNAMLGLIYRHDLTINDDHTDAEKCFAQNSELFKKKYSIGYKEIVNEGAKLTLPYSIIILMRAPYPIQSSILQHLNIDLFGDTEQEAFSTPLAHVLITRQNLKLRSISPHTLRILDETQFSCMHDVTIRHPRFHEKYLDEDTKESAFCTPISSTQKEILSSLPDQFMQNTEVRWLFDQSICGEKPSALTTYVHAPISMMFHAQRPISSEESSRIFYNPLHSRDTFSLLLGILFVPLFLMTKSFFNFNVNADIVHSCSLSMLSNILLPASQKDYSNNQKCLVKRPAQIELIPAIIGICINLGAHNFVQLPLKIIIPSTALVIIPFMLYDYCKYGLLYPIKTQSIAQLIQNHTQNKKRGFCTPV